GMGAQHAKIILPSVKVVENRTIYLNILGHLQTIAKAISLPIGVWEDHIIFLALALYLVELDSRIFQRVHRYAYNIITWSDELKLCYIQQYLRTQRLRIERVENRGIYIHDVQCQAYIQLRTSFGLDIHADEVIRMDYLKLY